LTCAARIPAELTLQTVECSLQQAMDDMIAEVPYMEAYPARGRWEIMGLDDEVNQPW
jgi:hypothetical protein